VSSRLPTNKKAAKDNHRLATGSTPVADNVIQVRAATIPAMKTTIAKGHAFFLQCLHNFMGYLFLVNWTKPTFPSKPIAKECALIVVTFHLRGGNIV
jgi:hypothetical protein